MARDRKMRSINCPRCGKPMKKHPKKREYECRNPGCPIIFVRVHRGMKRVGVEPRFNEKVEKRMELHLTELRDGESGIIMHALQRLGMYDLKSFEISLSLKAGIFFISTEGAIKLRYER